MDTFPGFTSSETFTQIPDSLLALMSEIDDIAELKVTLYAIWRIEHLEGHFRAMCQTDFDAGALGMSSEEIQLGLEKAVERGTLLRAEHEADVFYFLNSPRGRLAAEAFAKGNWRESAKTHVCADGFAKIKRLQVVRGKHWRAHAFAVGHAA